MKRNEFIQVKSLTTAELKQKAQGYRVEIANLTLDNNMKKLKDVKAVSKKRKDLAQTLTVLKQKEQLEKLEVKHT